MNPIIPHNNFYSSDKLNPKEIEKPAALPSLRQNTKDTANPFFLNQSDRSTTHIPPNDFRTSEVSNGSERKKEGLLNSSFSNSPLAQSLGERNSLSIGQNPSPSIQPIFHRSIGQTPQNPIVIASSREERNRVATTLQQSGYPYLKVSSNSRELRREENHPFSRGSQISRLTKSDREERSTVFTPPLTISSSLPEEQFTNNRQGTFTTNLYLPGSQDPILSQQRTPVPNYHYRLTPSSSNFDRQIISSSVPDNSNDMLFSQLCQNFKHFNDEAFQEYASANKEAKERGESSIFHNRFDLNEASQTPYSNRQIISRSVTNSHDDMAFSQLRQKFNNFNDNTFQEKAREIKEAREKAERGEIDHCELPLTLAPFTSLEGSEN